MERIVDLLIKILLMFLLVVALHGTALGQPPSADQPAKPALQPKILMIGNSLTWDTRPPLLDGDVQWHVDCGKSLTFIRDNPAKPCVETSTIWPTAMHTTQYDFVSVQPHYGTTTEEDLAVISDWVTQQTKAVFIIHTGWARYMEFNAERSDDDSAGLLTHSDIYFNTLLKKLRTKFPAREFRCTKAMNLLFQISDDIKSGTAPFESLEDVYRDKIHLKTDTGRYLMHNAVRRTLGQPISTNGFPEIPAETRAYLDKLLQPATAANSGSAEEQPVVVFILAGQSNMQGQGVVEMDHVDHYNGGKGNLVWSMQHSASKDRMQHLRKSNGDWVVRDDVKISFKADDNVREGGLSIGYTGYGRSTHIGPELQFGHVVGDHFDQPVLLIKTAWGGKSLHVDFRPPSSDGETGPYYKQMISEIHTALSKLNDARFELAGFVWMQGWNDMISTTATTEYADNLVHLANDVRTEFDRPELPFVVGELGNDGAVQPGSSMDRFRTAQRNGTSRIKHARFVETHPFARPQEMSPNTGHGHHWYGNAESYFLVGDALGTAAVDLCRKSAPAND